MKVYVAECYVMNCLNTVTFLTYMHISVPYEFFSRDVFDLNTPPTCYNAYWSTMNLFIVYTPVSVHIIVSVWLSSHSPDIIHVTSIPTSFATFPFPCVIVNTNQRKMGQQDHSHVG